MKLLNILVVILVILVACNEDDNPDINQGDNLYLSATIKGLDGNDVNYFEGGNDVGLYIASKDVAGQLNNSDIAVNLRFSQSAGGLVPQEPVSWQGYSQLMVYGYYPYSRKSDINPEAYPFTINTRQDTILKSSLEYRNNDFLWTCKTIQNSDGPAMLTFQHLMSKIVLHVKNISPTTGNMVGSDVAICNLAISASIDLGKGVVESTGNKENIVSQVSSNVPDGYETAAEAIVIPQTVTVGTPFLEIKTLGGYTHTWHVDREFKLESGKQITLDVLVKENECLVKVKEIVDWKDEDSVIVGEAIEDLPTFQLFDFYDRKGVRGIVIDVDETGKHGWVVSTDEVALSYNTYDNFYDYVHANNNDDGTENLKYILEIDPTLESHPAFKWVNDKNISTVVTWELPAYNVLKILGRIIADEGTCNKFNTAIQKCPVANSQKNQVNINRNDMWGSYYYLSSTVRETTGHVRVVGWSGMNGTFYGDYYDETTLKAQNEPLHVRAFCKF